MLRHLIFRLSRSCLCWCPCWYTEIDEAPPDPSGTSATTRDELSKRRPSAKNPPVAVATTCAVLPAVPPDPEMTTTTMLTSLDVITPPNECPRIQKHVEDFSLPSFYPVLDALMRSTRAAYETISTLNEWLMIVTELHCFDTQILNHPSALLVGEDRRHWIVGIGRYPIASALTAAATARANEDIGTKPTNFAAALPSPLVTQSAPNTPISHRMARHDANGNSEASCVVASPGKPLNNNYYRAGIGTLYEGIFSCFRPVWGYFGRSNNDLVKSIEDDWEIPFEAITGLEWLGAGSQGAVFRGCLNGQTVAVKKVKLKEETEIKHLRHLNHPNIIKFIGVCTQAPCYCLVMEYCPNGQLGDILKSDRVIGWEEWCSWSRQIAEGMEYLHKNKVIHRDLKSPNILFDEEGVVKICDFGTSHQQKKQNSTVMSFCGTVSWMAPEVIKKQPCCEKVRVIF
ncbi:kinase domain protein, partial [Ostertagia ostertagi]